MKSKTLFKCSNCHQEFPKWQGKCDVCHEWNTLEEINAAVNKGTGRAKNDPASPKRLTEVQTSKDNRIITDNGEFNRVMGGGIVRDSLTIITAKPGAGKSTLLLQVAEDVSSKGLTVLYASGEESESQIKNRAERILGELKGEIWVISDTSLNNVLAAIKSVDADLIIIDSIQTFTLEEHLPSRAGSPTQTMECANELLRIAKDPARPRAVLMVGQMNKNEEISGLRALEHLVDTVLIIDAENGEELRGITASKNRFGSTGETSFFSMAEDGMKPIENPSEYFMTKREASLKVSGSALTVVREGTRPIIAEVESLVAPSFTPYPSRISENINRDQLNTLISILEQRGGIDFFNKNVVVKATGGLKLREQSANLAIVMSIVSSAKDRCIPYDTVFISDIGLTGELKKVPSIESRLKEADRMGFKKAYVAKNTFQRKTAFNTLEVIRKDTLLEVIEDVFGN